MARFFRRRKFCRFTAEGVKEIDYKDLDTLKGYITETGVSWLPLSSVPATWHCCRTRTATITK